MSELQQFLSHAVALETDAAERYDELHRSLDVHHNPEIARLFQQMAHYSRLHRDEARERADRAGGVLAIDPWAFEWGGGESPESAATEAMHYRMGARAALAVALDAERSAHAFYAKVAASTSDSSVRALAEEFAEEELGHAVEIERWIERLPEDPDDALGDLDPPIGVD